MVTTKDVTRRGNVVGYDAEGRQITVEPRRRSAGKTTPWAIGTYTADGFLLWRATFPTKEAACEGASKVVVKKFTGW